MAVPALGSLIIEPVVRTVEAVMVGRLGAAPLGVYPRPRTAVQNVLSQFHSTKHTTTSPVPQFERATISHVLQYKAHFCIARCYASGRRSPVGRGTALLRGTEAGLRNQALSIGGSVVSVSFPLFNFFSYATTPMVARALARDDEDEASRLVAQ
eukprot:3291743-Rhodomonas_salina.1